LRKGKKMRSRRLFGTGCINGVWMKIKILYDPARVIQSGKSRAFFSFQGQTWWTYRQATTVLVHPTMLEYFPTEMVQWLQRSLLYPMTLWLFGQPDLDLPGLVGRWLMGLTVWDYTWLQFPDSGVNIYRQAHSHLLFLVGLKLVVKMQNYLSLVDLFHNHNISVCWSTWKIMRDKYKDKTLNDKPHL